MLKVSESPGLLGLMDAIRDFAVFVNFLIKLESKKFHNSPTSSNQLGHINFRKKVQLFYIVLPDQGR